VKGFLLLQKDVLERRKGSHMLGVLPSSSSLLPGVIETFSQVGWKVRRENERSCHGVLKGRDATSHDVVFGRPDGAMQLLRTGYAAFCVLGLDKLYESSGGRMPNDCAVYELPHISRKGIQTDVVLFSKKYRSIFPGARIASEYPAITKRYCARVGRSIVLTEVSGSAEVLVALDASDFGVAINETGETLRRNGMRVVATLLTTSVVLVCKKDNVEANEFCGDISQAFNPAL
jgi:ATP phosphoribosyltransferase